MSVEKVSSIGKNDYYPTMAPLAEGKGLGKGEVFGIINPPPIVTKGEAKEQGAASNFGEAYHFNGEAWSGHGNLSLSAPSSAESTVAGTGMLVTTPASNANSLTFRVRGNIAGSGEGYGFVEVQLYDDPDASRPTIRYRLDELPANFEAVTVPIWGRVNASSIRKVQFVFVGQNRSANFEVSDVAFGNSPDFPIQSVYQGDPYRFVGTGQESNNEFVWQNHGSMSLAVPARAGQETSAGLGINIRSGFTPPAETNSLTFNISGNIGGSRAATNEYSRVVAQVYRQGDQEGHPSSQLDINLTSSNQEIAVPILPGSGQITRVQFLYVSGTGRPCNFAVTNLRFSHTDTYPLQGIVSGDPYRFNSASATDNNAWEGHGPYSLTVAGAPQDFTAGLGINMRSGFNPTAATRNLRFNIRGNIGGEPGEGRYGRVVAQVFRQGDAEGAPSATLDIEELSSGGREISLPITHNNQPIVKVQLLYIGNGRACQFEVTNVRFE